MAGNIKRFAINAASGWLTTITFTIVGLILMPYIISRLGMKGYGIYQLANSTLSFFLFLHLGMGPTLVRFFSKAIARNETEELHRINSTAGLLLGGLGLLGCLAIIVLSPVFVRFYEIPEEFLKETIGLLICMGVSLFLNLFVMPTQGIVYASNRYDLANYIEIGHHLFRLAVTIALFELVRPSIFFVGLSVLLSQFLRFTALFGVAVRHAGRAAIFSVTRVDKESVHSILGFSVLNLANSIAATAVFQGPVLVIGKVLGAEMAAAFAPALIVSRAMQGVLGQTTRPLVPMASQDRERNEGSALGGWAIAAGQLAAFIGFGITLPLATYGPELVNLWLGEKLVWIWPVIAIMSTGVAISQIQSANYYLALGGGKINPFVCSQIVMAIVVLAGTIIGTVWFDWGLLTVALFVGICIVVRNTFYLAYACSLQFLYSYIHYLRSVYAFPAMIAVLCAGFGWILKIVISSQSLMLIAVQGILVLSFYVIIFWIFLLPRKIKDKIMLFVFSKIRIPNI